MGKFWGKVFFYFVLVSVTSFTLYSAHSNAAKNSEELFPQPADFISSDDIKRLDIAALETMRTEMVEEMLNLKPLFMRTDNSGLNVEAIKKLARFQTQEVVEGMLSLMRAELTRVQSTGQGNWNVFVAAVEVLGTVGTAYPHRYIEELLDFTVQTYVPEGTSQIYLQIDFDGSDRLEIVSASFTLYGILREIAAHR